MTNPIGIRIDKEIRTQLEKDAKKSDIAVSTYASKILADWTTTYNPMLEGGCILFPIPLLKIFYNFIKEEDYETIANQMGEYWHDSIKAEMKNPSYDDYIQNLNFWISLTNQKFIVLRHHPIKHILSHTWGIAYSKISCNVLRKVWESLGFRFEQIEIKDNVFSYYLHEPSQDL